MPAHRRSLVTIAIAILLGVSTSWAQSVYWSPPSGSLQVGKVNTLSLFFEDCSPQGEPELPEIPGLELRFRGSSNSTSIVNGRRSSKTIVNYQAIPGQLGSFTIPAMTVNSSAGPINVPAARYEIVEATVGNTGIKPGDVFLSRIQIQDAEIYEGEVFDLEYFAGAKRQYQLAELSEPVWDPADVVTAGLEERGTGEIELAGQRYTVAAYDAQLMATESRAIEISGPKQTATIVVGRNRDFLFQQPVYDSFALQAEPLVVRIKPLPPSAPASFAGAVGDFTLQSRVVPEEVQVGEPVTWTLELKGKGNWPAGIGVPARSVAKSFRTIQPDLKNEFPENDLFDGSQSEDIVLIPTEPGVFQFGPIDYSYFDPSDGRYKTISIPATSVTVTPSAAPQGPGVEAGKIAPEAGYTADPSDFDFSPTGDNAAMKSPELPKEPAAGQSYRVAPQGKVHLLQPTLLAIAAPLALWLLLAIGQSLRLDPKRPNRRALRKLRALGKKEVSADPTARRAHQRAWRKAAAAYLNLNTKEPTPDEIARAAEAIGDRELAEKWRELWLRSDRILFRAQMEEDRSWSQDARELVKKSPRPRYSPTLIFTKGSWFAALGIALAIVSLAPEMAAQEAAELYAKGDFAQAEELWTKAVDAQPNVFENRYNAGLAAAQQKDWGRAWGYWLGAFCLDPNDERVIWNLRLAHSNTGAFDPLLRDLLDRDGVYRLIRWRSPAGWESFARGAIVFAGIGFALAVLSVYGRRLRRLAWPLLIVGILGVVGGYFGKWAASKYEGLGSPDTLLIVQETPLRSIPTDLAEEQIASSVREGTVAQARKSFLSWIKVELPNEEVGWIRRNATLPLYGPIQGESGSP